jgi:hypothetical protein
MGAGDPCKDGNDEEIDEQKALHASISTRYTLRFSVSIALGPLNSSRGLWGFELSVNKSLERRSQARQRLFVAQINAFVTASAGLLQKPKLSA